MTQIKQEAHDKVILFLREELAKLKTEQQKDWKNRLIKQKSKEKKLQKFYQKIEAALSITSLDAESRNTLQALQ